MIIKELRGYDSSKLKSMFVQLKSSLLENRFKLSQGELTNVSVFKQSRRVIAQILTILRERGESVTHKD